MEIIKFANICESIHPKKNLEIIVNEVISNNKASFSSFYKKNLSKIFNGYSNYSKVPDTLIAKQICIDSCNNNLIATVLFSEWKKINEDLFNYVSEMLRKRNYETREPNFELTQIECSLLKSKDSISINNLSYAYFDNPDILEKDRLKQTLATVFLGWYPSNESEIMNEENFDDKQSEDSINSTEEIEINQTENNFKLDFEKLHLMLEQFNAIKSALIEFIDTINSEISKENAIEEKNTNSMLKKFNEELAENTKTLKKFRLAVKEKFGEYLDDDESELLKEQPNNLFDEQYSQLLRIYENVKSKKVAEYHEKLTRIYDEFKNLPIEDEQKFVKQIDDIKERYLKNIDLTTENEIIENLDQLNNEIKQEVNSFGPQNAIKIFLESDLEKPLKYLFDYFDKNHSPSDLLVLFILVLNNKPKVSKSTSELLLKNIINNLSIVPSEYAIELLKQEQIINLISQCDPGIKFSALSCIILNLTANKEIAAARLYNNGLYQHLSGNKLLSTIADNIKNLEDIQISQSDIAQQDNVSESLSAFFKRGGSYTNFISTLDNNYSRAIEIHLLPELENYYSSIKKTRDHNKLLGIQKKIRQPNFVSDLYRKVKTQLKLHKNKAYDTKILHKFQSVSNDLIELINQKLVDDPGKNNQKFTKVQLIDTIKEQADTLENSDEIMSFILRVFDEYIENDTPKKVDININHTVAKLILTSNFYNRYCPQLAIYLSGHKVNKKEICTILVENLDFDNTLEYSKKLLLKENLFDCVNILSSNAINPIPPKLLSSKSKKLNDLERNEKLVEASGYKLSKEYYLYKSLGRWQLCELELETQNKIIKEKEIASDVEITHELKNLEKRSAELNLQIIGEEHIFRTSVYEKIREALNKVGILATSKKQSKIKLGNQILEEIDRLRKFPNESIEVLTNMLNEIEQDNSDQTYSASKFYDLPLIDILNYTDHDDYSALGISQNHWKEISADRKEDIIKIVSNWEFLKDKPTTKDEIKNSKYTLNEIQDALIELLKGISRICSLYVTNDNQKIGVEPTADWDYSYDLPFAFTTRIKSPRCSSLDKPIHFYVFSQINVKSRKYIGRVKDFISEKSYDKTGFNVFIILDNEESFSSFNTYTATRSFPILGQKEIKRIVFSVSEKKLPKWELVFLLTLNNKISNIQPFKTQGLVDSSNGIFVGRSEIITKILNSQKDFAIYGGRRIGKSSLLSELRKVFSEKGFFISYQLFQGIDNSLTVAKLILADLYKRGLKTESQIPINTFDDFTINLLQLYRENEQANVLIILDEVDELILLEEKSKKHQIIEVFRNVSHKTAHKWRFVFAGFKKMYMQINGKGIYEHWQNPWQNFIDDTHMQLSEIESPRELIDEGLKDILGLEYERDVSDLITDYSTGHPAFLQKFCECLIKSINNRISPSDRRIYKKDVENVFEKENEFISFVKHTLEQNLSVVQRLISVLAAIEQNEVFTRDWIMEKINYWAETFELKIDENKFDLDVELELLTITGVIKTTNSQNEFKFNHPHFIKILNKLERVDKDLVENFLKEISA